MHADIGDVMTLDLQKKFRQRDEEQIRGRGHLSSSWLHHRRGRELQRSDFRRFSKSSKQLRSSYIRQKREHTLPREDHKSYSRERTMQNREPLELKGERIMQSIECMKPNREYIIYNKEYTLLSSVPLKWRDNFIQQSKELGKQRGEKDKMSLQSNRTSKILIGWSSGGRLN